MRNVLVTTEFRGVFFGQLDDDAYAEGDETVVLEQVCNVIYWPVENQGFLGLASMGPKEGARIGARAERIELRKVTSVVDVNDDAAARFESAQWK